MHYAYRFRGERKRDGRMALDRDTAVRLLISGRAGLLGYIYSIVRDWATADDVFQEVSILTLKKCESIGDVGQFGGWVRAAARLESLSALRKRGRGPRPLGDAVLDLLDAAWDAAGADGESLRPVGIAAGLHEEVDGPCPAHPPSPLCRGNQGGGAGRGPPAAPQHRLRRLVADSSAAGQVHRRRAGRIAERRRAWDRSLRGEDEP